MNAVSTAAEEAAAEEAATAGAPNRWVVLRGLADHVRRRGDVYAFSVFHGTAVVEQRGLDLDQVMTAYAINMGLSPIPMLLGGWAIDRGYTRPAAFVAGILLGGGWVLSGIVASRPCCGSRTA